MSTTTAQPLSQAEALELRKWDPILIKRTTRKLWSRAVVTEPARRVGDYVLLSYSHVHSSRFNTGAPAGEEVLRAGTHVAVLSPNPLYSDRVLRREPEPTPNLDEIRAREEHARQVGREM